ncbi:hypothetical protein BJV77DRAFT_979583 [Russula vinacea]|nr:hypothetical protein BJV77DRAFT_979583 [Russula vinacea]
MKLATPSETWAFTATDFDADLAALPAADNQAQLFLYRHPIDPPNHYLINQTGGHPGHHKPRSRPCCHWPTLSFLSRLLLYADTAIFCVFISTRIRLEWCPSAVSIAGIKGCIDFAQQPWPPTDNHREPNTIAFQKAFTAATREFAISARQVRWRNAN